MKGLLRISGLVLMLGVGTSYALPSGDYHPGDYIYQFIMSQYNVQLDNWGAAWSYTGTASAGCNVPLLGVFVGLVNGDGSGHGQVSLTSQDGTGWGNNKNLDWNDIGSYNADEHTGWGYTKSSSGGTGAESYTYGPFTSTYRVLDWGPPPGEGMMGMALSPDEQS